ncbi:putative membrane-associated phospholipid phosphatase [Fulvivirga imtechensis AK7]|uniref:Putative membrane-associated phospholipid phosphatase n=1 Tax=Fulvivirga imtechensis AK7 TaxID=1237149 RepID=L8JTQ0_9BACT|nr:phosphatase PAP2 family protein [Fulvivirga imtechensis]ELR70904.1 putative membrane-associated phospholipid phosphatase [Fulvivirga imtechensis AK7]
MLETLIELDKELFFFLNGLHTSWLDSIMFWVSDKLIWIPFYAWLLYLIIKEYKWKSIIWLIGIGLAIAASDQILSGFMKPFFERYRPSRDPELEGLVHIVNGYTGGRYGFASSHAGNVFALAIFLYSLFKEKYKWIGWLFLWAGIVSYSRVYLGVHYPGDIIVGAVIGTSMGWLFYTLSDRVRRKYYPV